MTVRSFAAKATASASEPTLPASCPVIARAPHQTSAFAPAAVRPSTPSARSTRGQAVRR